MLAYRVRRLSLKTRTVTRTSRALTRSNTRPATANVETQATMQESQHILRLNTETWP